jgi:hypothetical protein
MEPCKWVENKNQVQGNSAKKLFSNRGIVEFSEGIENTTKIKLKNIEQFFIVKGGGSTHRIDVGEELELHFEHCSE